MERCDCGHELQPVEFTYDAEDDLGRPIKKPSCNGWFCQRRQTTVLDTRPYERGEFAALVAAWKKLHTAEEVENGPTTPF